MNFFRSRLSIGKFLGQRCRQTADTWSHRGMCNKPQEVKAEPPRPAAPAPATHTGFRIPDFRPSEWDKRILIWSGRFKTADQIPEFVSFAMIDAARNRVRVKACYVMMGLTVMACLLMIYSGKQAAGRQETLTRYNLEKKAKWKEELQNEKAAAVALSEKTQ
uniref:protein FAM162B n=1 Tax=Scatophagus argus TaxID=75038 RepID=UPI001ED7D68A|nr:protein FAM162B [Scatophagus argus]